MRFASDVLALFVALLLATSCAGPLPHAGDPPAEPAELDSTFAPDECGQSAIACAARHLGLATRAGEVKCATGLGALTVAEVVAGVRRLGLQSTLAVPADYRQVQAALCRGELVLVLLDRVGGHWIAVLGRQEDNQLIVHFPPLRGTRLMPVAVFRAAWGSRFSVFVNRGRGQQ